MVTEAQGELEGPTFIDEDSSRAQAKQLSPCWRLRLFPIHRLEVHPKH